MATDGSDEREFLHDIASPIGTAMFLVDIILENMQSRPDTNPEDLQQMIQVSQAMDAIRKRLAARREVLIKRGVPSARA